VTQLATLIGRCQKLFFTVTVIGRQSSSAISHNIAFPTIPWQIFVVVDQSLFASFPKLEESPSYILVVAFKTPFSNHELPHRKCMEDPPASNFLLPRGPLGRGVRLHFFPSSTTSDDDSADFGEWRWYLRRNFDDTMLVRGSVKETSSDDGDEPSLSVTVR
jgi:hypothetical protein